MKAILGRKIGMAQLFQNEKVVPVTLIEVGPCRVTQVKTKESDGYEAFQVGYEENAKTKNQKSKKTKPFTFLREFRDNGNAEAGSMVDISLFEEGDVVKISGISKGKGFQGGVKRHGFAGRGASHGVKHEQRTIGSTGGGFPQRVIKGRKMPGRMGAERVSVANLKIAKVDKENNILAVRGAVPGRRGTLLEIRSI